ncbi:Uncharacterised protein [Acinetobacter baumannii]|nr:Uncharacterised protein [Acinetobacter baumannii]
MTEVVVVGLDGEVTLAHQPELPPAFIPFNLLSTEGLISAGIKIRIGLAGSTVSPR